MEFWIKQIITVAVYIGAIIFSMLNFSIETNKVLTPILTTVFVWVMNKTFSIDYQKENDIKLKDYQKKIDKELEKFKANLRINLQAKQFKYDKELENYEKILRLMNSLELNLLNTFTEDESSDFFNKGREFKKIKEFKKIIENAKRSIAESRGFFDEKIFFKAENGIGKILVLLNKYETYLNRHMHYVRNLSNEELEAIQESLYDEYMCIDLGFIDVSMPQLNEEYKNEIDEMKKYMIEFRELLNKAIEEMKEKE